MPDIDHVAVAGGGVGIGEAGNQDAAVEGDDLAVLLAARRAGRADIVLAAPAALDPQLLRGGLVGQMHDHAAALAGADGIGLLALGGGLLLGAGAVGRVLVGGKAPFADQLLGADGGGHFRLDPRFRRNGRLG